MTKIFVHNAIPSKELMGVIQEVTETGYDKNQAFIGANFAEFAAPLKKGDTAVVYSLTAFHSVTEILAVVESLAVRGIELRSIQEPWLQDPKITAKELLAKLFSLGQQLHQSAAQSATPKIARKRPRTNPAVLQTAARVALAVELIQKQQRSVADACRTAGCSVSAYYTHKGSWTPLGGVALKKRR